MGGIGCPRFGNLPLIFMHGFLWNPGIYGCFSFFLCGGGVPGATDPNLSCANLLWLSYGEDG